MAERVAGKAKKRARKSSPAQAAEGTKQGAASAGEGGRIGELERECARLVAELAAARERLKVLEEQRKALVNRIDWVIDSLHSLMDE